MAEDLHNGNTLLKINYEWRVQNYKGYKTEGYGEALESPRFPGPNGHSFKIIFYPGGATLNDYIDNRASFAIETTQTAQLVLAFRIMDSFSITHTYKTSSFDQRDFFRHVFTVQAGHTSPTLHMYRPSIEPVIGYSLKIKATIGVFINTIRPPIDPFLYFRVNDNRFFAERSIIEKRCPALLPNHHADADIVISDVGSYLFEALLWFIYHNKLHFWDRLFIEKSNRRDPNSFRMRIRRVAIHYQLPGFAGDSRVKLEDLYRPFLKAWNTLRQITKAKSKVAKIMPDP
ncbi:uncharacterized protein LOC121788759 [Salvia splendens]|uniref:uncharacterized protein LOC121788759 n=1 Tax=Salvia splendens TaxID=180675 RepID=UPI001C27C80A|nr:uncharacterized protein LOC121788759 [Salvia splendens]